MSGRLLSLVVILLFLVGSVSSFGQALPVSDAPLKITYSPAVRGIFHSPDSLTVVYAFNYWGDRQGTRLALWENVLRPLPDRVHRATLTRNGDLWEATITIAPNASVLSYFVTDGKSRDDNDRKTYVQPILKPDGTPVRNAHYFMTTFLHMAGEDLNTRVREAELEVRRYPDNFRAYPQFFGLLLEQEKGSPRGQQRIVEILDRLGEQYMEESGYLNLCARTWYYILRDQKKGLEYRSRIDGRDMWGEVASMVDMDRLMDEQRKKLSENERRRAALLNTPFPSIQVNDLQNKPWSFARVSGTPVVILFWASTSDQSLNMLPVLNSLAKEFGDECGWVAVTTDINRKALDECLARNSIAPPVVLANPGLIDALALDSIPQVFILDAKGVIRSILVGYKPGIADEIRSALQTLR